MFDNYKLILALNFYELHELLIFSKDILSHENLNSSQNKIQKDLTFLECKFLPSLAFVCGGQIYIYVC